MKLIVSFTLLALALFSCTDNSSELNSQNPYAKYFYKKDTVPVVYMYRNVAHGLEEQFHRIYTVTDSHGEHIVVEIYTPDGRIIEALNYNTDSLDIMDHMVVDAQHDKRKADVLKTKIIPMNDQEEVWFASRFPSFLDSTVILNEIKRKVAKNGESKYIAIKNKVNGIRYEDYYRKTQFNPFTHSENAIDTKAESIWAEGFGLVEWYDKDKKVHFKLEKIYTQKEWINLMQH